MSQVPVELIVAAFQDEQGADKALKKLQQAKKQRLVAIQNAAVIRRDAKNRLHISETADWSGGKGAAVGALIGGAIGLIFPPSVLAAGAVGAGIAGLGARLRDSGFPDQHLREIGAALKPGTSAIVAVVEHTWVADLERELAAQGAKTVREAITADIAEQLAQGREVAYTATSTGDAVSVSRTAAGKDSAEMSNVTMTAEGVTAGQVVVDKDNVEATGMKVTKDEATVVAMKGKFESEDESKTGTPQADSGSSAESTPPSTSAGSGAGQGAATD